MQNNPRLLAQVQNVELELLKQFQAICKKYNLKYFAIGGTCIGAIRHSGFIPWDDDIDVAMPYKDYKTFRDVAKSELKYPYSLYDHYEHKHCYHSFLKIHDESTTFIEDICLQHPDRYTGVFLDIMPIFGLPNKNNLSTDKIINRYLRYLRSNRAMRFSFTEQSTVKGKFFWIINAVKKIYMPYNYYSKKLESEFGKYVFEESKYVLFGWRNKRERIIFKYNDFKETITVKFENTEIAIPIGYDSYLRKDFGEYMKLPPKREQLSMHPTAIIDLEKSYKMYVTY